MKFLIAARPYNHQSFGVVCLHQLRQQLLDLGHDAELIFFTGDGKNCQWSFSNDMGNYCPNASPIKNINLSDYLKDVKKTGYIIYPEIIFGNPIGGNNIVRYLLNGEGALKPWGMDASKRDFFLVHSKKYRASFDYYLLNLPSINWLEKSKIVDFEKRTLDATYIGKGQKYGLTRVIKNTFEITRQWPSSQEQLRYLLCNTRFFLTFDHLSATIFDAILCGAIPCIFYPSTFDIGSINESELPTYSANVKLDEYFNIKEIEFDKLLFLEVREKTISIARELEASYPSRVSYLADAIKSHFG
jgi:hypothetical protein